MIEVIRFHTERCSMIAVIAQLVEHFLGKEEVTSSNLVNSSIFAVIAQLVEHFLGKEEVTSSNLVNSSKKHGTVFCTVLFCYFTSKMRMFSAGSVTSPKIASLIAAACALSNPSVFTTTFALSPSKYTMQSA